MKLAHAVVRRRSIPASLCVATMLAALALSGCRSFPAKRSDFGPGKVLVLPTRDVVQNGVPHEYSPGTGRVFSDTVGSWLGRAGYSTVLTDNPAFTHTQIASQDAALTEGRRLNADYVLQATLGEFRNAAPATFRSDFVRLESAQLLKVSTGETVWRLTKPIEESSGNIGNHLPLIESLAKQVGKSISRR